ncbi:DUF4239 domain-containing protein [Mycobacterium sp. 852002-51057_SCH5723018]|uniref:bestrophin-like domain n=1 Tax=Mycobacterium sp. 852002-51057_SCH5723018 TaxID=1834094 RepID=UPI001E40793E|nr:DUF4239 domain-containing protein [Mycobacterium sp. 852002-51057_SCH5723018]
MSRWILSNVPSWLVLLGLVVLLAGGAVLVQMCVRHRFSRLKGDQHNDAIRFAFGVVGFVFAFFTGFVASAMWGQVNNADVKARTEGAVAVQMARDLTVFDKGDSDRIRQSLVDYERAAIAEWPIAANGHSYPEAENALKRLSTAYQEVQPRTDTQKTFLSTSFTNLDKISQARTERVLQARTDKGPPWSLWAVILLTSGLLLGCAIVYGVEEPVMHYAVVAIVGVLVAANLFLVLELSHPFIGKLATSAEPLRDVIHFLSSPPS